LNIESLIKACQKQNRKAQEELYHWYKNTLFVLSLKYCANEVEAEDNLHNAFIEIFTNISKYKDKGSFEGWMKRITINKAIDTYKKKKQLYPIKDDLAEDTTVEETEVDLPLDYLLQLIQDLPHQYRIVFNLYELDDYSHKEIAELLSISEGTSKSNLHRAKIILKEKIKLEHSFLNYSMKNGK
jgi:RNA polymerase sigma factor (sigma-70 family)